MLPEHMEMYQEIIAFAVKQSMPDVFWFKMATIYPPNDGQYWMIWKKDGKFAEGICTYKNDGKNENIKNEDIVAWAYFFHPKRPSFIPDNVDDIEGGKNV